MHVQMFIFRVLLFKNTLQNYVESYGTNVLQFKVCISSNNSQNSIQSTYNECRFSCLIKHVLNFRKFISFPPRMYKRND